MHCCIMDTKQNKNWVKLVNFLHPYYFPNACMHYFVGVSVWLVLAKLLHKRWRKAKDVHALAQESYDNAVSTCPGF